MNNNQLPLSPSQEYVHIEIPSYSGAPSMIPIIDAYFKTSPKARQILDEVKVSDWVKENVLDVLIMKYAFFPEPNTCIQLEFKVDVPEDEKKKMEENPFFKESYVPNENYIHTWIVQFNLPENFFDRFTIG